MNLTFETELEDDGRWIAEVPEIPGAMAYGATRDEAIANVIALHASIGSVLPQSKRTRA